MKRNQYIPDFGVLNRFFDEDISPEEFLNDLTDIITEYSTLALMAQEQVIPLETSLRINTLNALHREIRKNLK